MRCWSCGTELAPDSNYCHRCGVRIRRHQEPPKAGETPPTPPPDQEEPPPKTPTDTEEPSSAGQPTGPAEQPTASGAPPAERPGGEEAPSEGPPAEREVWVGRPHIGSLAGRFTFAGLCALVIIGGLAVLLGRLKQWEGFSEQWRNFFFVVALVLLGALGLWLIVSIVKTKLTLKYRLTTERLLIERGFLTKRTEEVDLLRVDEATVHQGLFDRLANVGNIVITSTEPSDPLYIIVGVEQPVELKEKIRQYARELRRRSLRPNDR